MLELFSENELPYVLPSLSGEGVATVHFGKAVAGTPPIEVLSVELRKAPTTGQIREAHAARADRRNVQLAVAIQYRQQVWLYGPATDRQPLIVSSTIAQRVLQSALDETDSLHAAYGLNNFLNSYASTEMPGIKNKGLFATHHLRENIPQRRDWGALVSKAESLSSLRDIDLVKALGFKVTEINNGLVLSTHNEEKRAVALLLHDTENFESPSGRFPASPVSWGLSRAYEDKLPWLIVLRRDQIRLYPARDGIGVGQKGQSETFFEINLAHVDDTNIGLLPLIFSAESLAESGETQKLLEDSAKYAAGLGERLRERIYEQVVPLLSVEIANQFRAKGVELDSAGLASAYSATLHILFRLLFQAYAEDRGLLPSGRNEYFDANSLKTIANREMNADESDYGPAASIWADLTQIWDSIDQGNPRMQIPAYNGGLFGKDEVKHPEGYQISRISVPDNVLGPALRGLLIDITEDGVLGPVDFRSLSVREFGTIYEGLLESSLSLADTPLTVNAAGYWVPAKKGDQVLVAANTPYFHSVSGERKATGSYFTPKFVVDHLVSSSIDPALAAHLEKVRAAITSGDQSKAHELFFDFRVADLAMGSGHFLVAAVDRIEATMRSFLAVRENQISGVVDELERLKRVAIQALGNDQVAIDEIEDAALLRRQIVRRCIYGLDINPIAVELARLALWIHTFVPGLPMSSLDHNLVSANSLTGIGTVEEALEALDLGEMLAHFVLGPLEKASESLIDYANATEATKSEVAEADKMLAKATATAEPVKAIFAVALAKRLGAKYAEAYSLQAFADVAKSDEVTEAISGLNPAHMPYLFPEVFVRENSGFDVLLGNPPWDKITLDEQRWWGFHLPGVRAFSQTQKNTAISKFRQTRPDLNRQYEIDSLGIQKIRESLSKGQFPGIGQGGNMEIANIFAWRNWQLLRSAGYFGLVLPRTSLNASALKVLRKEILQSGTFESVVIASNKKKWVFDIHEQYTTVFVTVSKTPGKQLKIVGPVNSAQDLQAVKGDYVVISTSDFVALDENLNFPIFPDQKTADVYKKIRHFPSVISEVKNISVRLNTGLNATTDSVWFDTDSTDLNNEPIWGGASFNLWDPNYGGAWARVTKPGFRDHMKQKFERSTKTKSSSYFGWNSSGALPTEKVRVAYRWITNRTNQRTTITSLILPGPAVNSAPTFALPSGNENLEGFILGVLSSQIFDWQARFAVELNFTLEVMASLTCPYGEIDSPLGKRLVTNIAGYFSKFAGFEDWAKAANSGTKPDSVPDLAEVMAENDALVALMYGLDVSDVEHIFATFHFGADFSEHLTRVIHYYEKWAKNV